MRSIFPGYPWEYPRDITRQPAIASCYGNTDQGLTSTSYATVTLNGDYILDGFTRSGNIITCYVPGCYELTMAFVASAGSSGYAIGYRINGGTEKAFTLGISGWWQVQKVLIHLHYGDTIEGRFKCLGAAETTTLFGAALNESTRISLQQISEFPGQ